MRIWLLLGLLGCATRERDGAHVPNLAIERGDCHIAGCSLQVCSSDPAAVNTTCDALPSYTCYRDYFAVCEPQPNGACGWTANDELDACLDDLRGT